MSQNLAVMRSFILCLSFFQVLNLSGQNAPKAMPFSIGQTLELPSLVLGEQRTLNVYLPEGYHADDTTRYAVIYLLDGSADEDFIHVAGLVQFCNFPWVNILPPTIVVGIANVDRKRDFTFPTTVEADKKDFPTTGGSARFISFIETELQPFIERQYRTNGTKTLIGQSLGGLLATEILFKKPGLFNNYLLISPSLWWDRESLLQQDLGSLAKEKLNVHISVGDEEKIMKRDARTLVKKLKAIENSRISVEYNYLGKEDHASIMHLALYDGFKWLGQ